MTIREKKLGQWVANARAAVTLPRVAPSNAELRRVFQERHPNGISTSACSDP
ncbi:hypothetical protein LMG28614_04241 [Paraburkholderia ultramafica]|uniref:Uncharacterized protein n=1 Tax=Paraburkholderia ultramafica TaxID=1544867 RepID=A0A6S7BCS6_9BURK|nr:hypothetical protein LMG28614_04241 [Paraburkholderia ultramafica]